MRVLLILGLEMKERENGQTLEGSKRDGMGILRDFKDRKADFFVCLFLEVKFLDVS